jgi:hypothetical protein
VPYQHRPFSFCRPFVPPFAENARPNIPTDFALRPYLQEHV